MKRETFERFRDLIYNQCGIVLPPEKKGLLENRLSQRLRALGLHDEGEYLKIIELDVQGSELVNLINVVSTNTTYFYREAQHFSMFRSFLKEREAAGKSIKVWCAAASSGEEPYTLAMEALEVFGGGRPCPVKILATDISTRVLQKAVQGVYPISALSKIPPEIAQKYCVHHEESSEQFVISQTPRELLLFKKFNLVEFPYPLHGPLDIIFCRNVMIYFDNINRQKIVAEFERLLSVGGYLVLSHSENLLGIANSLVKIGNSVFKKVRERWVTNDILT
jgi:chemotaxis protein methyltransferase CheR